MTTGGLIGAVVGGTIGFFIGGPVGAMIGAGIGAGLGMWVDPLSPDMPSPGQADTGELSVTTAEEGAVVFDVLGTTKITGNLLWYGKERVVEQTTEYETGKGGGDTEDQVTGYKYYMSWAVCLCLGPVDEVLTIVADDTVVWQGHLEKPASGGEETITLGVVDEESSMGTMTFYFGTSDQVANSVMTTELGADLNPAYRHFCYAFFNDCYLGTYNRQPTMKFVIRKTPSFGFSANNRIGSYNYNAAHALWYVLTDMVGLPDSYLNTTDFASMASTLNTESIGISIYFSSQTDALTYIESILFHVFGILRYGNDGTFHPKLLRDDIDVGSLPSVTQDSMLDDLQLNRPSWLDTINELKVRYARLTGQIIGGQNDGTIAAGNQLGDPWRSLMKDSSNNLHVIYRGVSAHVYHAISTDLGLTWSTSLVESTSANQGWVGAAIDSEDVITAVWYDGSLTQSDRLRYAQYENGSWSSVTVIPVTGEDVAGNSFAFASTGTPLVLIDNTNNVYCIFQGHTGLSYGGRIVSTRKMKVGSTWADWEQIGDNLGAEDAGLFSYNTGDYNATFDAEGVYMYVVAAMHNPANSAANLVYARGIYQNWVETDQVTDMDWHNKCWDPLVVIDYQNVPNIVWEWRESSNYQVRFTRGSPGSWVEETIVATQSQTVTPTVSVSGDRLEIHIFYQKTYADIYHLRRYYTQAAMFGLWAWDSEELLKDLSNTIADLSALYAMFPGGQNPDEGYAFVYRDSDGVLKFYSDILWETEGGIDFEEAALMISDSANQSVVGRISHQSVQLSLFTSETEASWAADRMIKGLAYPLASVSFPANRDLFRYEPGDLFILTYAPYSITGMVCRVVSISEDSPESEVIQVNAIEDVDYLASEMTWTAPVGLGTAASWAVEPIDVITVLEPPYYVVGDELKVGIVTARQMDKQIGAMAYISTDDLSYQQLGQVGILTPYATLDSNYTIDTYKIDDTTGFTITFSEKSNIDMIQTVSRAGLFGDYNLCMLGDEIMAFQTFTFVSGTTYTCTGVIRALFDTDQVAHTAGEEFWFLDSQYFNAFDHSFLQPNRSSYFKAIMFNSRKSGVLSNAERHTLLIEGRAKKPYKPSNLSANNRGNYATYSQNILLKWNPRIRGDGAGVNDADTTTDAPLSWEGLFSIEVYVSSTLVRTTKGVDSYYYEYTKEMNEGDNGGVLPSSIEFRVKNYIYTDSNYFYSDYESVTVTYDSNAPGTVTLPPGNRWEVVVYALVGIAGSNGLISFSDRLYAGGSYLCRWDGNEAGLWEVLSDYLNMYTYGDADKGYRSATAVLKYFVNLSGTLYVGSTGYVGLWKWDGSSLTEVTTEMNTKVDTDDETTMQHTIIHNSKIYAAYTYVPAGGAAQYKFLEWNGVDAWVEKTAPPAEIKKFCVLGSTLYAMFAANMELREWNEGGDSWDFVADESGESFGDGFVTLNSKLYATSTGNWVAELWEWPGSGVSWTKVADDIGDDVNHVFDMIVFDGYILACTTNDGVLLKWNGIDTWESVADHVSNYDPEIPHYEMESLKALSEHNSKVYCIGDAGHLLRWGGA